MRTRHFDVVRHSLSFSSMKARLLLEFAVVLFYVAILMDAGSVNASTSYSSSPTQEYMWTEIAGPSNALTNIAHGPGVGDESGRVWDAAAGFDLAIGVNGTGVSHTYKLVSKTWEELHAWTPQIGLISPGWTDLVYDSTDGYPVLLIEWGLATSPPLPSNHVVTWKFESGVWSYLQTRNAPQPSPNYVPAVDDPSDAYLLLMGGGELDGPDNSMWGLHAGVWTHLPDVPISANLNAVNYAFDPNLGKLLVLGNFAGGGGKLQDWTFHAGVWESIHFTNRLYDNELQPTYDPAISGLLAWGEPGANGGCHNAASLCLWLWEDGTSGFVNITSQTSAPLDPCGVYPAYDPALSGLICDGALSDDSPLSFWEFT
jgi:hypothetical protein